ncbi:EAL domain-containing protein [Oceanobacillus massiliensis]|uniref:EAL domain-containing protein n=1 Tax=Oceanobacillus massiliensis TaxID=1465765 RepID=UPI000288ABCD|nr:EAL domain-containing protein [Oceanobacillus massiliensis]
MKKIEQINLDYLIDNQMINHYFQPIYDIQFNGKLSGYEALLRSNSVKSNESLFHAARNSNRLFDLDTASIILAAETWHNQMERLSPNMNLFLTIHPSTIVSPGFTVLSREIFNSEAISPEQVVFVINEPAIEDYASLKRATSNLKSIGFQIAVSNVRREVSSIQQCLDLQPDIIRLDACLSFRLADSSHLQQILTSLLDFGDYNYPRIAIEWIQTNRDFPVTKSLGAASDIGHLSEKQISKKRDIPVS